MNEMEYLDVGEYKHKHFTKNLLLNIQLFIESSIFALTISAYNLGLKVKVIPNSFKQNYMLHGCCNHLVISLSFGQEQQEFLVLSQP